MRGGRGLGECVVNKPAERGVALVEWQALERGLRLNLRPEALQNGVDEAAALAWIEAEGTVSSAQEKRRFSAKARNPQAACDCRMDAPP